MLDVCPEPIVCVDDRHRVVDFNPAAAQLLGLGDDGGDIVALLGTPALEAELRSVIEHGGAPCRGEHTLRDGLDVEITVTGPGNATGCAAMLFVRDVTARRRSERLRDVEHRLARALAAARSGREVAGELLAMVAGELGFEHGELWVTDPDGETQRLFCECRTDDDTPFATTGRRLAVVPGTDLAGMAWEIGETVCVDDARSLSGLPREEAIRAEGIRGCAAIPMRAGDEIVGTVVLARVGGGPLDPELRQTLHSIGAQLAQFAERRLAERRLAEETVAVAAVARATRRLSAAVDRRGVAEAICQAALEVCEASVASVALPDPDSEGLILEAVAPSDFTPTRSVRFEPDAPSVALRAFRTGEAVFLADITDDPDADVRSAEAAGLRSALVQPIVRENEPLGVLIVAWRTYVPHLGRSTELLVRLLADEATMALPRADLFTRLETAARTDPLTGLANLRAWDEQLARELASARRDGRPVAVAVLDLDGFKTLNDERGHQHGDRVLRAAAAGWMAQLRQGDTLARLGGDEFAALLPGCRPDDAVTLAERLRAVPDEVTVSIGVAYWDGAEAASQLRGRADAALYAAKAAGRNRVWIG